MNDHRRVANSTSEGPALPPLVSEEAVQQPSQGGEKSASAHLQTGLGDDFDSPPVEAAPPPMEETAPPRFIGKLPPFVTADEAARLTHFEAEVARLQAQVMSLVPLHVERNQQRAFAAYVDDPTDENLSAYKAAALDGVLLLTVLPSEVRSVVEHTLATYVTRQVRPFVGNLLSRGETIAQNSLDQVSRDETARHLEMTGETLRTANALIESARQPLTTLRAFAERLVGAGATAGGPYDLPAVFSFLRAHCEACCTAS